MAKQLDFKAADGSGYVPDLSLIGRQYRHQNGKLYAIGGFSFDADRDRWMIGYIAAGGVVPFMRLPEHFFGLREGKPRFVAVQ